MAFILCVAGATATAAPPVFQRPLSTDRPDATESPFTVEAGRWQIETEAGRWGRDDQGDVRVESFVFGATNFKYGLTNAADLQVIVEPYVHVRVKAGVLRISETGFGDTTVRLKLNFAGNDGGSFGWGLMPFVKLPTASDALGNGAFESGLIIPFAFALANGWSVGLMGELDYVRNDADNAHILSVFATATIAGEIAPGLSAFFEIANEADSTRTGTWATSFNTGLTFFLRDNIQLDAGINVGLTTEAEDFAVFFGLSCRM